MHLSIQVLSAFDILWIDFVFNLGNTKSYSSTSKYVICSKIDSLKRWKHCRFSFSLFGKSRQVIIFQLHCYSLLSGKEEASIMNRYKWKCRYPCTHRLKKTKPIFSWCLLEFHLSWILLGISFDFRYEKKTETYLSNEPKHLNGWNDKKNGK